MVGNRTDSQQPCWFHKPNRSAGGGVDLKAQDDAPRLAAARALTCPLHVLLVTGRRAVLAVCAPWGGAWQGVAAAALQGIITLSSSGVSSHASLPEDQLALIVSSDATSSSSLQAEGPGISPEGGGRRKEGRGRETGLLAPDTRAKQAVPYRTVHV